MTLSDLPAKRLANKIGEVQKRIEGTIEHCGTAGPWPTQEEVMEELRVGAEELRVAGEELRSQNEELARQRQRYADLFNFAPDAYLVTDADGSIEEANVAAVRLLHCSHDFLIGKPLVVFVAQEEHRAFRSRLVSLRVAGMEKMDDWRVTIHPRESAVCIANITVGAIRDPVSRLKGLRWAIRVVPR